MLKQTTKPSHYKPEAKKPITQDELKKIKNLIAKGAADRQIRKMTGPILEDVIKTLNDERIIMTKPSRSKTKHTKPRPTKSGHNK